MPSAPSGQHLGSSCRVIPQICQGLQGLPETAARAPGGEGKPWLGILPSADPLWPPPPDVFQLNSKAAALMPSSFYFAPSPPPQLTEAPGVTQMIQRCCCYFWNKSRSSKPSFPKWIHLAQLLQTTSILHWCCLGDWLMKRKCSLKAEHLKLLPRTAKRPSSDLNSSQAPTLWVFLGHSLSHST